MACLAKASATSSTIGPDPLFLIVTLLAGCMSWINLKAPDFFGTVNHRLEYGAIDGSSIPICIFSFNRLTNLGSKALGTGIGFKSQGTWGIVKMTIGATIFGLTHPISSGEEAKALPCLEIISRNLIFSGSFKNSPPPIFSLANVSSVKLCPIFLVSLNPGSSSAFLI
ncbi:hypothetical protein M758_4G185200 [Ceratodon purpureus]|uniref:Uncharacterized protein n=1 Tax=Ceratodon purpureus TaxID=3225 RepID=A0A8T0GVG8_CERPU|nr:hypothetical protein KC19_12G066600 [Ceratodon purpureus]KAG0562134.1 hypothetical protein KC19_9G120600 [Ceratodon purpureus]KAG0594670.1 hypothetical protein M758_UG098100 [Ceratodon purpureus]KAG0594824.1 hypothetical protein M758_UG113100 [Ceratodon purpureus]KAG0594914.1 hypothetical protein M758_UG121800 [Ceratodon purpureus]